MPMPLAEPLAVVALLELDQGEAQLLHRVERAHPKQLLLEGADESLGDPVAFRLAHKGGARRDPQELQPVPDCAALHAERRKPGVTLELLHLEYLEQHPDGYRYTQFCELYRRWLHPPGPVDAPGPPRRREVLRRLRGDEAPPDRPIASVTVPPVHPQPAIASLGQVAILHRHDGVVGAIALCIRPWEGFSAAAPASTEWFGLAPPRGDYLPGV